MKLEFRGWNGGSKEVMLNIRAKPYVGPPLPQLVQPVTVPVKLCCCIPKGTLTVAANGENSKAFLVSLCFMNWKLY